VAAIACALFAILTAAALAVLGAELALAYRTPAPADWAAEANAERVERFYAAAWAGGRAPDLAPYVAADHALHDPAAPEAPAGPEGVAEFVAGLRRALPDLALTLDDAVARGDRVAVRFTVRGTHRGPFLGAEGTGRAVTVTGVAVHRLAAGQIAETWLSWDAFGLARQVGLFLLPESALGAWEGAPGGGSPGSTY
jgi:steroid delta-isomerase-like uncharacterized protein